MEFFGLWVVVRCLLALCFGGNRDGDERLNDEAGLGATVPWFSGDDIRLSP